MSDAWNQWLETLSTRHDADLRLLAPEHVEEVLRIIRLHDTDDYRAARRTFEHYAFDGAYEYSAYFVQFTRTERNGEPEERLAGVSGYWSDDSEADRIFWLDWTYVNPFFQGEGIGSTLLAAILETVEELDARKIYVATSSLPKYEAAVGLYEKHGFAIEATLADYYAEGEDQIILGQTL